MPPETLALLTAGIFVVAILYSAVGHAGASGYIAIMSLIGLLPGEIKPTALTLNILVASIGSWKFWRAGHFNWNLFWPFALLSVPLAYAGGYFKLPISIFKYVLGAILIYAAGYQFFYAAKNHSAIPPRRLPALVSGGVIGLISGLTGTGGGIFLTPLLLMMRWATTQTAAAISALFILVNSAAALAGTIQKTGEFPPLAAPLLLAAGLGGWLGASLGSQYFNPATIKRCLAAVLLIAGIKLVLT